MGVPTGGTTGQALVKSSNANYATTWQSINSAAWGNITGTLSSQTDLNSALNGKLSLDGGTMGTSANVAFPNIGGSLEITNKHVKQTEDDPDTSSFGSFELSKSLVNGSIYDENNWSLSKTGISCNDDARVFGLSTTRVYSLDGAGWSFGVDGLQFNDSTQQTTAGIPAIGGTATGQINIEYDNSKTEATSSYVYTYETNNGTNPQAYGVVYTGGFEAGDSTGQWIEFTPSQLRFGDGSIQTTAATGGGGDYLPLAGGTMTGNITFDGTSGQYIGKGTFDTSRGGNYGLSLVCSIGYEFNWQAGWLTTTNQSSTTPRSLYLDSLAGTTLKAWDSSNDTGIDISHTAITFADSTVQSTAAVNFNGNVANNLYLNGGNQIAFITRDEDGQYAAGMTLDYNGLVTDLTALDLGNFELSTQRVTGWPITDVNAWGLGYDGLHFSDGTTQTTAAVNPSNYVFAVYPSELSQSGDIAHTDYPLEIQIVINGQTYAVPARVFE